MNRGITGLQAEGMCEASTLLKEERGWSFPEWEMNYAIKPR
jgi:hypothetical protein